MLAAIVILLALISGCSETKPDPVQRDITLTFTAVGNAGTVGQAGVYQLRWSTDSMRLVNPETWATCQEIPLTQRPKVSGSRDSIRFVMSCEPATNYFFGLMVGSTPWKTCDTCTTTRILWSPVSNIAHRFYDATIPPAKVSDLQ